MGNVQAQWWCGRACWLLLLLCAAPAVADKPRTDYPCTASTKKSAVALRKRVDTYLPNFRIQEEKCSCFDERCEHFTGKVKLILQEKPFAATLEVSDLYPHHQDEGVEFLSEYLKRLGAVPLVQELAAAGELACRVVLNGGTNSAFCNVGTPVPKWSVTLIEARDAPGGPLHFIAESYRAPAELLARAKPAAFELARREPTIRPWAEAKDTSVEFQTDYMVFHQGLKTFTVRFVRGGRGWIYQPLAVSESCEGDHPSGCSR